MQYFSIGTYCFDHLFISLDSKLIKASFHCEKTTINLDYFFFYNNNKERILQKQKDLYEMNKEEINAKRRERYAQKKILSINA